MSGARPYGAIIGMARGMRATGADATAIRAALVAAYGSAAADQVISRLRRDNALPARSAKLERIVLMPAAPTRERLRALAAKRGISHHRAARQALAAGLAALEARP